MDRPGPARKLRKYGKDISSRALWREVGPRYRSAMDGNYHRHRFRVISSLLDDAGGPGKRCLEFGCGDGLFLEHLARGGAQVTGIDIDPEMIRAAERRLSGAGLAAAFRLGSVADLAALEAASVDLLCALDVASYLTDEEERALYEAARRLVGPGGALVFSNSNKLFDLFTFNAFSVDFLADDMAAAASREALESMLARPRLGKIAHRHLDHRVSGNRRDNPLAFPAKLARYGFEQVRVEFMNFHPAPPQLMPEADFDDIHGRDFADTLNWPAEDRWRLAFMCSMFAVHAVKTG